MYIMSIRSSRFPRRKRPCLPIICPAAKIWNGRRSIWEPSLSFSSATQGAELYYSIGNSTGVPDTPYDPSTGIIVEGSYSETFTVRVMAVRDGMLDSEIRTFIYNIADKDARMRLLRFRPLRRRRLRR